MLEFFLIAMFQAVVGSPAPAPVTETPTAAGAEHAGHAAAPAETAPTPTTEATEAPAEAAQETSEAPAEAQQADVQRGQRVCREEASSGSRLRARRRC